MAYDGKTRPFGKQTYISSLLTKEDEEVLGLASTSVGPLFVGDVAVANGIVFPDGTTQTSAGVALPDNIDCGSF